MCVVHESHVRKCSIVTIVEWWLQLVPADACQVFLCVCGGGCRSCRCRWGCRSCACCHCKLCQSSPDVLSGSRLCPTRFPLFSFLLCLLVCLCSCCRCCCPTCRQCKCFSSRVDVPFVCVRGIGAHLDCVTRITAPLPCKVSLFQLSVNLLNCQCPVV